jgi:hypothetical protein
VSFEQIVLNYVNHRPELTENQRPVNGNHIATCIGRIDRSICTIQTDATVKQQLFQSQQFASVLQIREITFLIFKLLLKNFKLWMLWCQNKLGMVADLTKVLQCLRIFKLSMKSHKECQKD